MTQRQYFGTDGLRACVGSTIMNPVFVLKLGWAIGTVFSDHTGRPSIVIGRDTRISGEMLQSALVSGLLSAGCDVILLGVLPTPAIAYLTEKLNASAGIVISASHNAFEDNGIKCIGPNGMKLPDEWELAVEALLSKEVTLASQNQLGSVSILADAESQYVAHCHSLFPINQCTQSIVLDCANGAASSVAPAVFEGVTDQLTVIHNKPNGTNINSQCGATHLVSLQEAVVASKADIGFAFDGDADRLMMVDHTGAVVDGDEILGIIALHGDYQGVAGTLMTNLGLEKVLAEKGIEFERAAVGDRYVLAALLEKGWQLGGESSGHVINLNFGKTGDGIVTALQVLAIMQKTNQSLFELKQVIQKRPQILVNVSVEQPKRFSEMDAINEAVAKVQATLGTAGRVLLRASGTESCVRVMVEADDAELAQAQAQALAKVVESAFGVCL